MKTYRGTIEDGEFVVEVHDAEARHVYPLPPRLDLANKSPTGLAWGYLGSGPAQLSLAILSDHLGPGYDRKVEHYYQDFKADVIATFDRHVGWELTTQQIEHWLAGRKPMPMPCWQGKITVPDDAWEDSGPEEDPKSRLLAELEINGTWFHLEAFAVEYREQTETTFGEQHFADLAFEDEEHAVLDVFVEGAAATVTIKGREYALVVTPHQA
jgi:hypothetical protein